MAIDLDAIRKKLNQLSGNNSKRNSMWRPQEGEDHTVRILAFSDNDGQPFKERWFYYNIGNNPGLLAPHQFGQPDPIQDLINTLRNDGTKESYELAKKLYPKMRSYAPVIVRGEEAQGVRLWSFGKTVYQSLLNLMLDDEVGDFTDPSTGRDIKVTCTKPPGRMWATTEVRPRMSTSDLADNAKQAKQWLDSIPDLDEMYTCKSYDELETIVNAWLNGDETDDSSSNNYGSTRGGTTQDTSTSDTPAATNAAADNTKMAEKYASLDDAFADIEKDF